MPDKRRSEHSSESFSVFRQSHPSSGGSGGTTYVGVTPLTITVSSWTGTGAQFYFALQHNLGRLPCGLTLYSGSNGLIFPANAFKEPTDEANIYNIFLDDDPGANDVEITYL